MTIPEISTLDWLMLILTIVSIGFAIYTWIDSSHQIAELQKKLDQTTSGINQSIIASKNELMFAIYETKDMGMNNATRDNYFFARFGITYDQASKMLEYVDKTDDYSLGIDSLTHFSYNTSLYHFDLALIKDSTNIEAKVGKSASLIGLNKNDNARQILFEIEPGYKNKAFLNKLIGDSYFNEKNYENATTFYVDALGLYMTNIGPKDIASLEIFTKICEMKANGLFNSPFVSVENQPDGWKIGEVKLIKYGIAVRSRYQYFDGSTKMDWIFVRKFVYPEPELVFIGLIESNQNDS